MENLIKKNILCIILMLSLQILLKNCTKKNNPIEAQKEQQAVNPAVIDSKPLSIFSIYTMENERVTRKFISISELYQDSITVPPEIIQNQKNIPFSELKRIELSAKYREKMLKATGFKESDTLYIFNYDSGIMEKSVVRDLIAVANLNFYTGEGEEITNDYYMLGFELKDPIKNEKEIENSYNTLAYIGAENPFVEKPLTKMVWSKVPASELSEKNGKNSNLKLDQTYKYDDGELIYYVQDWKDDELLFNRYLTVKNKKNEIVLSTKFENSEGSSIASLNGIDDEEYTDYQWSGYLFKNKPKVAFYFEYQSFGCPQITFTDKNYAPIIIHCDNRH